MPDPSTLTATLLFDARAVLGEGPVWDHDKATLYWVDIEDCTLHRHNPKDGKNNTWAFDGMIGTVIPASDGSLLLAHESGLIRFDPATGRSENLNLLFNTDPQLRFNDGKCDPSGYIWIGTMDKELAPHAGKLYRIDPHLRVTAIIHGTTVSNGMAWSPDHRYFYYTDTPTYEVWRFKYDPVTAGISHRKTVITIPEAYGGPDGMTIDNEGMLWIAHWGGGCVRRWDPDKGEVLQTIRVEAPNVTSCSFGGRELDILYITTARSGLNRAALTRFPHSGGLFSCRPGVKGSPARFFDINA